MPYCCSVVNLEGKALIQAPTNTTLLPLTKFQLFSYLQALRCRDPPPPHKKTSHPLLPMEKPSSQALGRGRPWNLEKERAVLKEV